MTKARTLADNFAADINGITAGTGITGGGTSGTVTVTNSMATAIDAKGDLVVGTGADTFSRLAVASTAGYLLSVDSGETTGLKWAAPAAGGKVLQVIYGTSTTETTNSTSTYADTTLSATITPASTSNKVLILVAQNVQLSAGALNVSIGMRILRASTEIFAQNDPIYTGGTTSMRWNFGANYLDSPSTTSATTYKTQAKVTSGAASDVVTQISSNASTIILLEIGA